MKPTLKKCAKALSMAAIAGAMAISADPAHAVNVTVDGTTYDIKYYDIGSTGPGTYDTEIKKQAWWGNSTLASNIVTEYKKLSTPYDFATDGTNNLESLIFYTSENTFAYSGTSLFESGTVNATVTHNKTIGVYGGRLAYAASTTGGSGGGSGGGSTAAPEIDANALTKALFLLFAFGVWQVATRSRQDIA